MVHARSFFYDAAGCLVSSLERTMTLGYPSFITSHLRHLRSREKTAAESNCCGCKSLTYDKVTALLGRRGWPTDGVEDYCTWLGHALANRGYCLNQVRVPWQEMGWLGALRWLWRESAAEWRKLMALSSIQR